MFIELDINWDSKNKFFNALDKLLTQDIDFFEKYYSYWKIAFSAYSKKDKNCSLFWLTNGCGQQNPRPDDWPKRKGTGFESISDGKTSVGIDRTDDIKNQFIKY